MYSSLITAVERGSKEVDVYLKLSKFLSEQRQYENALAVCQQGLKRCGKHPALLGNQGAVLHLLGRYEEALQSVQQQASLLSPAQQPWNNLGNIHCNLGNLEKSIHCFEQALVIDGQDADAHYNLAQALLLGGDYKNGFREYEWRPGIRKGFPFPQPRWDGSPLQGRRILLHQEGGMGDTIQFVRYLPLVRSRGGEVTLGVDPALRRWLSWMRGEFTIAPSPHVPFHVFCPMMSLPFLCGTGDNPIPPPPIFDIPQDCRNRWAQLLGSSPLPKIGLVWAGSPSHQNDCNRSMRLRSLQTLIQRDDALFFSLQVGNASSAIAEESLHERIVDLSPYLTDYAETAAAISQLDLVLTVDTSVAHLAATMNAPTWMMVPLAPEWRWLLDRSDSPWYSSMRIFRQKKMGDWDGVVREVTEALPDFLRRRQPALTSAILTNHTETVCARPPKRVLIVSGSNGGSLGSRLGFSLVKSLLPEGAEVHYANYQSCHVQEEKYDLLIIGTGDSLFQPLLTEQLLSLVRSVPRAIGIFGTQYREEIDHSLLSQVIDGLTVWFARHAEDLLLYGQGRQNALHLGDWLLSACPMTRWTKDATLHVGKEIPSDLSIANIQQYRQVFSEHLTPLVCALTSAERIAYTEQRERSGVSSGKIRSLLLDVFGRTWPESTTFEVDRTAVAAYRSRVMQIMSGMPQLFNALLGLGANA